MLRKFILVGIVAGGSAAFPIIYQNNPEAFDALLRSSAPAGETRQEPARVAAVQPRQVERQTDLLTGRKVRIEGDRRGHFVGEFRFNGQRMEAMVDTGATLVALNRSAARRAGIVLGPDDFRHVVDTANGRTRAAVATISRLELGRIDVDNVEAVVLDDESLSGILVGMSFLSRLRRYSVEQGALILEQ